MKEENAGDITSLGVFLYFAQWIRGQRKKVGKTLRQRKDKRLKKFLLHLNCKYKRGIIAKEKSDSLFEGKNCYQQFRPKPRPNQHKNILRYSRVFVK